MLAPGLVTQAYEHVRCTTFCDAVDASHMLVPSCTGPHIEKPLSGSCIIPSKRKELRILSEPKGPNCLAGREGTSLLTIADGEGFINGNGLRDRDEATGQEK